MPVQKQLHHRRPRPHTPPRPPRCTLESIGRAPGYDYLWQITRAFFPGQVLDHRTRVTGRVDFSFTGR